MSGKKWAGVFFTLALLLCACLMRWPDPAGPNGYFYLKNIQELSAFRGYYFRDYSLAFLFPAGLNLFLRDPQLSWALAVSLTVTALPLALSLLALGIAGGRRLGALPLFLLLFVLSQYPLLELGLVYFKNSFALLSSVASLACASWAMRSESEERGRNLLLCALGLGLLAVFSHKTMLLWLFTCGAIFLYPRLRERWEDSGGAPLPSGWLRGPAGRAAVLLLPALLLLSAALFYRRLGSQVAGSLSLESDPDAFWFWIRHHLELEPAFTVATGMVFAAWVYLAWRALKQPRLYGIPLLLWSLVLALDFHPWQEPGSNGLHYRLWLLLPVVPALLAGDVFLRAGGKVRLGLCGLLLLLIAWESSDMAENFASDFPSYSSLRGDVEKIPGIVGQGSRIFCRHGLEFFVDYVTGLRCRSFIDRELRPGSWRVAYLAEISSRSALADLRGRAKLAIGRDYVLLPEEEWRAAVSRHRLRPGSGNPMLERPSYINEQE